MKFQHRHSYDLQKTFDRLYKQSQAGNNFYGLMNIISSSENIMLAVRTIRSNAGSGTPGTDGRTIFVALIQKQFGTIVDRVVQQCVKQVLEPICEAKFYYHSYGFRPDRSAENAIQVNAAAVEFGNPRQETTEHNPSDAESSAVSECGTE